MGNVETFIIHETGSLPNNSKLPVIYYHEVFDPKSRKLTEDIQETFLENGWFRPWVDSIYDYTHYHSNNHEVLGIAQGHCTILLGGDEGYLLNLKKGDALILPAGVGHKKIKGTPSLKVVGAYSVDKQYDMKTGKVKLKKIPIPETDPVFGKKGNLLKAWKS